MLAAGTMLGPYQILAPLGAGGMGEVYRAHDSRLGRDAAIKVIRAELARDPERIKRFEQEARAAGSLSHPNICPIFDIGTHAGATFIVMELLVGESLRESFRAGPIPWRKAVAYAAQAARGLAAAHRKGIVHRDLKPENLFVTRDGLVKVLDFGLAKLTRPDGLQSPEGAATISIAPTESGTILGTVGYMSPEQVRGEVVDPRSDLFALGCILFEMVTGRRPFTGSTAVEQMAAILNADPPPLAAPGGELPPALERLVQHCLDRNLEARIQSASDLAYDLEALVGASGSGTYSTTTPRPVRAWRVAVTVAIVAILLAGGAWLGARLLGRPTLPEFTRLTYSRGVLGQARMAADGSTIVYSASWDGRPEELFTTRTDNPGTRALGLGSARILALSSGGELAVILRPRIVTVFERVGTLARVPLAGGAPRELLENVLWADWSPDGRELAVVHDVGDQQLEYPVGHVVYRPGGWISHPRVSPDGNQVAFVNHPLKNDDRGFILVVDRNGRTRVLTAEWVSVQGLAWLPSGDEILFTASSAGFARSLHKVKLSGGERLLARVPSAMTVQDVARGGKVLVSFETFRFDVRGLAPGEDRERDLSWLDHSFPSDLSSDGKTLLISEWAEAAGPTGTLCVRGTDGSPVVPLGHGQGIRLSPDGRWALAHAVDSPQYVLLPTGAGESRVIERSGIEHAYGAAWLPDGRSIVLQGRSPGRALRLYVQAIQGGRPRPVTPEGIGSDVPLVTPDGRAVWAGDSLYSFVGLPAKRAPSLPADETPLRWSADGHSLFTLRVTGEGRSIMELHRHDLTTGRAALLRRIEPSDPAGIAIDPVLNVSGDGRAYVYMLNRMFCDLYLVGGIR